MKIRCQLLKEKLIILAFALLQVFNVSCQEEKYNKTLWTVTWSPDGKYIATGGNQDELKLFDGKTFELIKTYPVKDVQLSRVKWHPTKNMLAVITQGRSFKAKILDLENDTWTDLQGLESSFRALDWNHTGDFLAVSELDGAISVFSIDGTLVSRFMADAKAVAGIDWHPSKYHGNRRFTNRDLRPFRGYP